MMQNQHEYEKWASLLKKIRPGNCPNFYLTGKSMEFLEKSAVCLADQIVKKKKIKWNGLVPYFSVVMPYSTSIEKADRFMKHLLDSCSIARDCYNCYTGMILIECESGWGRYGYNASMNGLLSFVDRHKEIHFIFLVPAEGAVQMPDTLFGELSRSRIWVRSECKTMKVSDCVALFCNMAEEKGLSITDAARKKLEVLLKSRSEEIVDNETVVSNLLQQIQWNKWIASEEKQQILEKDLELLSGIVPKRHEMKMGFQ